MFKIRKLDEEKHIVTGVVYAPNVLDTHGEMMLKEDVELLAHRYLQHHMLSESIDTNHENNPVNAYPVESFIARAGDPDYPEGAWVLAVKVEDTALWKALKIGEYNGYSFEAYVTATAAVAELEVAPEIVGETEVAEDHTHFFVAQLDDDGKVRKGRTSTTNGHSHEIKRASATEVANGHSHRFFSD